MKEYKTDCLIEAAKFPTQFDKLNILSRRKRHFTEQEKNEMYRLEMGLMGEKIVFEYLEQYGLDHWIVLRNIWFEHFGVTENDIVLLTNHAVYTFEVKNYTGAFDYKDGSSLINGRVNKNNIISQARKAYLNIGDMLSGEMNHIEVNGALIFVGCDNTVKLHSPVKDIKVVLRSELRQFILAIKERDRKMDNRRMDTQNIIASLIKHEVVKPHMPIPCTQKEIESFRGGISCANCGRFHLSIGSQRYIECDCGLSESLDEAVVRTICEYGVLRHDCEIKLKELLPYFGGAVNRQKVRAMLYEHFETVSRNRYTYHVNKRLPIEKMLKDFQFKYPKKMVLDRTEFKYI